MILYELLTPEMDAVGCQEYVNPEPDATDIVTVFDKQTVELLAEIVGSITGKTLTVFTAEAVHVPAPEITEYEVVVVGETTTVPVAGGLEPILAVHVYGPEPPITAKLVD